MIGRIETHVQNDLLVFAGVLGEFLARETTFESHDLFEVIGDVCGEDHFDNDLAHVPVLRFRQQLKDVILRVKKQLESDRTMMVLED